MFIVIAEIVMYDGMIAITANAALDVILGSIALRLSFPGTFYTTKD